MISLCIFCTKECKKPNKRKCEEFEIVDYFYCTGLRNKPRTHVEVCARRYRDRICKRKCKTGKLLEKIIYESS